MKGFFIIGFLSGISILCSGQSRNTLASLTTGIDRMSVVKSSIDVPAWHERDFWPLYEKYLDDEREASAYAYQALQNLAVTAKSVSAEDAAENSRNLIGKRYDELTIRKRYFSEIGSALNGVIALQFVQTETLMDMVESAGLYEQTALKQFKFYEHVLSPDKVQKAKRNVIASALDLSADDAGKFWPVYEKYEEEKDAALGEGYDIFSLYAGEASDFTPALAKRLGYDLLHITERELKLKEKYYLEMEKAVGPSVATRFLAWEDYHSLITKMHVWAEAN